MNILVITDVLWRNDNGVGNSYSNIFGGIKGIHIANICCAEGVSSNKVSQRCFQISESMLIRNILKGTPVGKEELKGLDWSADLESRVNFIRNYRLRIFFWIRELIWCLGRWNNSRLNSFIDDFKPDVIFAQLQDKMYLNRLVRHVQKYTGKPLFLYAWDDVYSWKQFSLSPLFWIDRLMQRVSIRKITKQCSVMYTISQEQKEEYSKCLDIRTELLYKGHDFTDSSAKSKIGDPIKILYTGNLYSGRCKTMIKFCEYLNKINANKKIADLQIYSGTPLSNKERKMLGESFKGKISEKEVYELQKKADILLHIEPFSLKGKFLCRLSFSTKLVDYFYNKKCIFAVGSNICSSMKYLKRNDAAVVAENYDEMNSKLTYLLNNRELIEEYAEKAWECGRRNHMSDDIQKRLMNVLGGFANESCSD